MYQRLLPYRQLSRDANFSLQQQLQCAYSFPKSRKQRVGSVSPSKHDLTDPTGSFIHPLIPFIEFQTFIGNCKRIEANKASIKIALDIIYLYMYVDLRQTSDGQITPSISDVYPIHLIIQTRLYIISDTLKTIKFASRYKLIIYGWLVYFGQSDIFYKNKSIDYLNVLLRTSACFIELTL